MLLAQSKSYNILSLDSAYYRGYMTANFTSYLEQKSYFVARRDKCIPEREDERISMTELFDVIAGSETGAIIAATLVVPNDDPETKDKVKYKYDSRKAIEFFDTNVDVLYTDYKMPIFVKLLCTVVLIGLFSSIVYYFVDKHFHFDGLSEKCEAIRHLITLRKREARGKDVGEEAEAQRTKCNNLVMVADEKIQGSRRHMTLQRILGNIINVVDNKESKNDEDDVYEQLTKFANELEEFQTEQNRRMGYKWYALILVAVTVWILA
jgi:hypothetical protein